ncbi:unnamed protein product, partial [Ilex paraguariensis]
KKWWIWLLTAMGAFAIILISCYLVQRKLKLIGKRKRSQKMILSELRGNPTQDTKYSKANNYKTDERMSQELHFFSFESIAAATDSFSITNKLGEGGFGPVYKVNFVHSSA